MFRTTFLLVALVILFNACNRPGASSGKEIFIPDSEGPSISADAIEVIYSLYLPTDIDQIFEETGTSFNPEFLIPLDIITLIENPGQLALLMGSLGIDLSYCKLFERDLESADCYKQIELLADKLGLPREIFEKPSGDLERYVNIPDSLTIFIDQVYSDADRYFKENDNESLATLSLVGGWLEAMYIGVRIFQDKSILEMGDRILYQKYSLNSLTGLLANYQESLMVRTYMHSLSKLKEAFKQVDIRYSQEGFKMNQEERSLHASAAKITYEPETLEHICQIIIQLREESLQ